MVSFTKVITILNEVIKSIIQLYVRVLKTSFYPKEIYLTISFINKKPVTNC